MAWKGKHACCRREHDQVSRGIHVLTVSFLLFSRKTTIVNLDPANEVLPYPTDISILELISLEDTMENLQLGPNGGIIYCMEYLAENMDWLEEKLKACGDDYIVFDCPGQVELYTHNDAMKRILNRLEKIGYRVKGHA